MPTDYKETDHDWIRELLDYPRILEERLSFFDDTSQISIPADPIERVPSSAHERPDIRVASGEAGGVVLKVRGWLDGLREREIPFAALGLR